SLNDIFGPSIGLRLETHYKKLTFGAQSKFTFSFNRHEDLVRTVELFLESQDPRVTVEGHTDFAPIHELQLYAQMQLSERLRVRVGYNLMTVFEVSRPYNNIYWNDSGVPEDPTMIVVRARERETFHASGLTIS